MSSTILSAVLPFSSQTNEESEIIHRFADFHPTLWGDYFLKYALESQEVDKNTEQQLYELKEEVKRMLPHGNVQLIDEIQRLGISYHFESEISQILGQIRKRVLETGFQHDDLYTISLEFRLLRQEGYNIPSDIFKKFTNKEGKFKDELSSDVEGMLGLYEAAHFLMHGEPILDEALAFAKAHLKSSIASSDLSPFLAAQVKRALKHSIRKGVPRLEAKHFISIYDENPSHSEVLLRFAKLNFNIVQKLHRKEAGDATRWWKSLDVESKLPYARDRLIECYIWAMAAYFEPKFSLSRDMLTKVLCVAQLLDDTYDAYGTFEELQALTDAVHRWDINCVDQLPESMKQIYRVLLDTHENFEEVLVKEGRRPYPAHYYKELSKEMIQCFMDEAKWLNENYVPTMEEYIEQYGIVSGGHSLLTVGSFMGMGDIATEETFEWVSKYPKIIRGASINCRLMDDIVGHKFEQKREHAASSVECYMKQYNVSEEEAYVKLRALVEDAWKDINGDCLEARVLPMSLLMRTVNLARLMATFYQDENCYTESGGIMKDSIKSLLLDPIPM